MSVHANKTLHHNGHTGLKVTGYSETVRNTKTLLISHVLAEGTNCQFCLAGKTPNVSQKDHENKFTLNICE